jgi:hypothetical protein
MNFLDERLPDRFWSKVTMCPVTGCWVWNGAKISEGYGSFRHDGKVRKPHRVAYAALVGPIPSDLEIDHLCRVRACCNPLHLEAVTRAENVRRSNVGLNSLIKTACPYGHEYDDANTRVICNSDGSFRMRRCVACFRARGRRYYKEGKAKMVSESQ